MSPGRSIRGLAIGVLLAGVVVLSGEVGARLDDWVFGDVSPFENQTFDGLFFSLGDGVRRGVPNAHWKRVEFNGLGMRGPQMPLRKPENCARWLFLGASQTFGEPGIEDGDFPSVLRASLPPGQCVEVANSASPGMWLKGNVDQFEAYLHHLDSDKVLIYSAAKDYLNGELSPKRTAPVRSGPPPGAVPAQRSGHVAWSQRLLGSRLLERIRDTAEIPAVIQTWRVQRQIAQTIAQHPEGWVYERAPLDRLADYEADLVRLVNAVRKAGGVPVFITHAVRVTNPPRPEDLPDLLSARIYVPRATPEVWAEFEYAAAQRMRDVAARMGVKCIDAAATLSGRREMFIDSVHFSKEGNAAIAALVREELLGRSGNGAEPGEVHAVQ